MHHHLQNLCKLQTLDHRRVVTSRLLNTGQLFVIRFVLFCYSLVVWICSIAHDSQHGAMRGHFSYFTYLCYTGMVAYLGASSFHTLQLYRHGSTYSFSNMPYILQLLHWLLYESAILFAIVVSTVFWSLIYNPQAYSSDRTHLWITVSVHATNSVCALLDLVLGSMVFALHWSHPLILCIIIALYLALAYVNEAINGWFTYDFIDYKKHKGMVAPVVIAILAGLILVYYILYGIQLLLDRMLPPRFTKHEETTCIVEHPLVEIA